MLPIVWIPNVGTYIVSGTTFNKWLEYGREAGLLRYPTSDLMPTNLPGGGDTSYIQPFQGGGIILARANNVIGDFVVYGPIYEKWVATGAQNGPLQYPTSDTRKTADELELGLFGYFMAGSGSLPGDGAIYWSEETGAHFIYGDVLFKDEGLGWENSCLGYPTSDQERINNNPNVNSIAHFERGSITWYSTGAGAVSTCGDPCPTPDQHRDTSTGFCVQNPTLNPSPGPGCVVHPGQSCNRETPIVTDTVEGPNGEEIPIVPVFDEDGNQLPITYVDGPVMQLTNEDKPPACMGRESGLQQEGVDWDYYEDSDAIGASVKWTAPSDLNGVISSGYGIWYNPINFYYGTAGLNGPSDFFQVDFGVGDVGVNGFAMTYLKYGSEDYKTKSLPTIPAQAGATYIIDAFLRNIPNTTTSEFVVQITLEGVKGWVATYPLEFPIRVGTGYINNFQSFNDEYIFAGGTASENVGDRTSEFALILQSGTSRARFLDGVFTLIPSETEDLRGDPVSISTFDIFSPEVDVINGRIGYLNRIDCPVWSD